MEILFIGGDKRMNYAADMLSAEHTVWRLGLGDRPAPSGKYNTIVLPLPLSKNGREISAPLSDKPLDLTAITRFADENALILAGGECPVLTDICSDNGYTFFNYFADEALTLKNAALTAEAACTLLSQSTDGSLLDSETLITGYGRIARYLARQLAAHGSHVTIAARRSEQRMQAELDGFSTVHTEKIGDVAARFDFIANTVPNAIFTADHFSAMKRSAVFIELATLPEQPSKPLAEMCGIKYIFAPGLPGKHSPKAAGAAIAEVIAERISK